MPWVRIDDKHRLRNDGKGGPSEPERALVRRIYGWNGRMWPRFIITIHSQPGLESSLLIGHSRAEKSGDWVRMDIPVVLLPELIDMLREVQERLAP